MPVCVQEGRGEVRCDVLSRTHPGPPRKEGEEDGRGRERMREENVKNRTKNDKKGGKMEFYNEYEPHGEVEQSTWQVWGQREEEQVESYK